MAVKLEITNLSLRLSGREILDRIHFSTENTITVILGENGAGKTTLPDSPEEHRKKAWPAAWL